MSKRLEHEEQEENRKHELLTPKRQARFRRKQPNYDRVKDILCRFALAIEAEERKEHDIKAPSFQEARGIGEQRGTDNTGTQRTTD